MILFYPLCRIAYFCAFLFAFFPVSSYSADYGGTFTAAYKDEPVSLNPLMEFSTIGGVVNQVVFDGLVTVSPSGKITPRLARKWTVSKDRLAWTFLLEKNVRFHDGTPMTANDVRFTYTSFLRTPGFITWKMIFEDVREVRVDSDFKVTFLLKRPSSNFLAVLYVVGVVPEHILRDNPFNNNKFNRNPIGTGPFKFARWKRKKEILLESNKNYFRGKPFLNRVRLVYVPDVFSMWKQLQLGKIDGIYSEILPIDFNVLKRNDNIRTFRLQDYMNYVIIFNFRNKQFTDKRLRLALNAAIDRKKIIRDVLQGNAVECNGIFRPGVLDIPDDNEFAPRKSIRLLKEMGYSDSDGDGILENKGRKLSFKITYDSGNIMKLSVIRLIQNELSEIGVEVIGEEAPIPVIHARAATGDFDMIFYNYNTGFDFPSLCWHSEGIKKGHNLSYYRNKKIDLLFDELKMARDESRRQSLMETIHKGITEDSAGIFLFTKYNLVAMNKRIEGFEPEADKFFWEFFDTVHIPKRLQKR